MIADWTRLRSLSDIQDSLDTANIGHAKLNGVQDLIDHPQLSERRRWTRLRSPVGPVDALLPPPVSPSWPIHPGAVPGLGEHTDAVLVGLGVPPSRIAALRSAGVV